jgi:hypothetical protein
LQPILKTELPPVFPVTFLLNDFELQQALPTISQPSCQPKIYCL